MKFGFGVDLGGTTVKIAYFNQEGTLLNKWEIPTNTLEQGKHILPDIANSINEYISRNQLNQEDLLGVGIGIPGPVNEQGIVAKCVNLGWENVNIPAKLSPLVHMYVTAGNDANVAALGEAWKGIGNGCQNMIMVTLGTGVGGGIVVGGKVIYGMHGAGGEIGHLKLKYDETEHCGCGQCGCAEQYCSATGVVRTARKYLSSDPRDSVLRSKDPLTCKDIFDAGKDGDPVAADILELVYQDLGRFLSMLCCFADPELIVLGGGVSKAGKPLLEGARRYMKKYTFFDVRSTRVALATLGNDAGAYGAFKLALDHYSGV